MRYSRQREIVHRVLLETTAHPDVDYVYREARKFLPKISLGTVYRNLNELCQHGFVRRFEVDGTMRYDAMTEKHAHFVCNACGKVSDVKQPQGLDSCDCGEVFCADVIYRGVCWSCRSSRPKNQKGENIV